MFERLAAVAAVLVVAIGSVTLGYSLITRPHEPAAGACPATFSEADAVDVSAPGSTQSDRAWGAAGSPPGPGRPGLIAGFDEDAPGAPQSVVTIDPATGARCRLVTFVDHKPIREHLNQLDWSPSGDALAIGLENVQPPEDDPIGQTGQVLIWTPSRLLRVWSGPGQQPALEWAPDGRSIAVWMPTGGEISTVQVIFADGSGAREVDVRPSGLSWSPDGSRWIITEGGFPPDPTDVSVVALPAGLVTPIDTGIPYLRVQGWLDDGRLALWGFREDRSVVGYMDVPVAAPRDWSPIQVPSAATEQDVFVAFSPDWRRIAYVTAEGDLEIAVLGAPGADPVHVAMDFDDGGGFSPGLAWAPDGSQVVFTQLKKPSGSNAPGTYATWIVNADGTGLREIAGGLLWTMDDPWQPVPVR